MTDKQVIKEVVKHGLFLVVGVFWVYSASNPSAYINISTIPTLPLQIMFVSIGSWLILDALKFIGDPLERRSHYDNQTKEDNNESNGMPTYNAVIDGNNEVHLVESDKQ